MSQVSVIFVKGDNRFTVDRLISNVTQGDYVHVAIKFKWGIVESLGVPEPGCILPGVRVSPLDKYDNANVHTINIRLSDPPAAEQMAKSLIGTLYSYIGCIEGGLYNRFGIQIHGCISTILNWIIRQIAKLPVPIDTGNWTMNCSETVARILKAGGLDVLPGVDADCITPMDLYQSLAARAAKNKR